jgi:copper chaperone NosL
MKRILIFLSLSLLLACATAFAHDKIEAPGSCKVCGMDRSMFAQSRMLMVYTDGESVGTCSLHCVATQLKESPGKKVRSLLVADCKSRTLIDAHTAIWVIGGAKSGVMTELPKWAFAKKDDADAFIKTNGGKIAGFEEAMNLAEKEQD